MTAGVCSGNSGGQRQCIDIKSAERHINNQGFYILKKSVFQSESEIKMYPGKQKLRLHC